MGIYTYLGVPNNGGSIWGPPHTESISNVYIYVYVNMERWGILGCGFSKFGILEQSVGIHGEHKRCKGCLPFSLQILQGHFFKKGTRDPWFMPGVSNSDTTTDVYPPMFPRNPTTVNPKPLNPDPSILNPKSPKP